MVSIKKSKKPFKNIKIRLRISFDPGWNHQLQPESLSPRWTVELLRFIRAGRLSRVSHPESRRRSFFLFVRAGSRSRVARSRVEAPESPSSCCFATSSRSGSSQLAIQSKQLFSRLHLFSFWISRSSHLRSSPTIKQLYPSLTSSSSPWPSRVCATIVLSVSVQAVVYSGNSRRRNQGAIVASRHGLLHHGISGPSHLRFVAVLSASAVNGIEPRRRLCWNQALDLLQWRLLQYLQDRSPKSWLFTHSPQTLKVA